MSILKFSRNALRGNTGGYEIKNTRSPGTGLGVMLLRSQYPADIAAALQQEEADLGYPAAYTARSNVVRSTRFPVWVTSKGMSIGKPAADIGLTPADYHVRDWMWDEKFVYARIKSMGLPSLDDLGIVTTSDGSWYSNDTTKPHVADLAPAIVRRVARALLGNAQYTVGHAKMLQIINANEDTTLLQTWMGDPVDNSLSFAVTMTGLAGVHLVFRFENISLPTTTKVIHKVFRREQTYMSAADKLDTRRNTWNAGLKFAGTFKLEAPALEAVKLAPSWVTANQPYNHHVSVTSSSWATAEQPIYVYALSTAQPFVLHDYAGVWFGSFYAFGMNPFLEAIHVLGPTTVDSSGLSISIAQEMLCLEWLGKDLAQLIDNPDPADVDKLKKLYVVSSYNLTGTWTLPKDPLYNLDVWQAAIDAEFDLGSEIFVPEDAAKGRPAYTFKQASDRASLKQIRAMHVLRNLTVAKDIMRVQLGGTAASGYTAVGLTVTGGVITATMDELIHAIRDGAQVVTAVGFTGTLDNALISTLGLTMAQIIQPTFLSRTDTATNEFDENGMFGDHLPNLSNGDLKTRSAFAMIHETPSRTLLAEVSNGLSAVMYHNYRRLTA